MRQAKKQEAGTSGTAPPANEILIGRKVKQARLTRNMRLKELAERSGFSESLISKIENDKTTPSLMTLHRIAVALDTNISWFFSGGPGETSPVLRAGDRQVIRTDKEKATTESFVPYGGTHLLQAFLITIHPGGSSLGPREHPGEEVGYLIEGELDLTIAGTTYHLSAGDSFTFRSERSHSYRNPSRKDVRIVWVNTPPTL